MKFSGSDGTEVSFKSLGGKNFGIIHIATHGFFHDKESISKDQCTYLQEIYSNYDPEDKTLSQSGLFLSGSADAYEGINIPNESEDGILTAQEISSLDFRTVDLVTISACDSGKGEISGDGVFGLQRGFKKAGAQSILMSLWKVDDEATCLLMTEFYKHWIGEGKTKHDALELAKQTVRSHKEKGWDNPEYWAAFILLDGLE